MNPYKYLLLTALGICLVSNPFFVSAQKGEKPIKNKTKTGSESHKKGGTPIDGKTRERISFLFIEAETQYLQGNSPEAINLFQQVIQLDPANDASYFNIAKIYLENGDADNAISFGKNALDLDETNFWYYNQLAKSWEKKLNYGEAAEVQARLVKKFPEDKNARYDLAQYYIQINKYQEAIKEYDALEKMVGLNEDVIYRKHQLYLFLKDPDKALVEIEKLVKAFPYDNRHLKAKYDVLMMKGENASAFALLETMLRNNPEDGFALLSLADYYKSKGDIKKSDDFLFNAIKSPIIQVETKLQIIAGMLPAAQSDPSVKARISSLMKIITEVHPSNPKVYGIRGDVFLVEGNADSAKFYYHKALEIEPTNQKVWKQIITLDAKSQDYKSMSDDASKALDYFPNETEFLFFSGIANIHLKNYEEAAWAIEKVKKISPENFTEACIQLGEIYYKQGQFSKSDENFDLALQKDPMNTLALNNYAYFLSVRGENLDKASEMVLKALGVEPDNSNFQDTYGWVLYKKGEYKKAEQWIMKALAAAPNNAEGLEHYGDVLFKLGEREKAIEQWKKAKENGATDLVIENKLAQGD